jgi:hypothetical protein
MHLMPKHLHQQRNCVLLEPPSLPQRVAPIVLIQPDILTPSLHLTGTSPTSSGDRLCTASIQRLLQKLNDSLGLCKRLYLESSLRDPICSAGRSGLGDGVLWGGDRLVIVKPRVVTLLAALLQLANVAYIGWQRFCGVALDPAYISQPHRFCQSRESTPVLDYRPPHSVLDRNNSHKAVIALSRRVVLQM